MESSMSSSVGTEVCKAAQDLKIACLLLDTRATGTFTTFKRKISETQKEYVLGGTAFETFEECLLDIDAAINYLKTLGYENFILSGHSTGCQKSLYYGLQKQTENIKVIILLAPCDDLAVAKRDLGDNFQKALELAEQKQDSPTLLEHQDLFENFSAKRFYDLMKEDSVEGNLFNYEKQLTHIKQIKIPILSVFGSEEQYAILTPQKMLQMIKENYSNELSQTKLIGGDHNFKENEEDLKQTIKEFIKKI